MVVSYRVEEEVAESTPQAVWVAPLKPKVSLQAAQADEIEEVGRLGLLEHGQVGLDAAEVDSIARSPRI